MLVVNHLIGFGARAARAAVSVVHTDNAVSATDLTEYTFVGADIGAEAGTRRVVVAVAAHHDADRAVSSVTVGGVSASQIANSSLGAASYPRAQLWLATVPTGTTADVVVTWSGAGLRCGIGVFALYNASATPHDTATSETTGAAVLDVPAKGAMIGVGYNANGTANVAWTNLTERYDQVVEGTNYHYGACDNFASAEAGRNITVTVSGSPAFRTLAVASFEQG